METGFINLVAAASGRSGTRRSTSGRSGAGRGTSHRSGTRRSGVAAADRSTAAVAVLLERRQLDLAEHVAERLLRGLAAAVARIAAGRGRSTAAGSGRGTGNRSSTGRGTSRGSGTGWGARGRSRTRRGTSRRSGTGRGRSTARRRGSAAAVLVAKQTGIGTVQTGETHEGSGNPSELHCNSPSRRGRERETRASVHTGHLVQRAWPEGSARSRTFTAMSFRIPQTFFVRKGREFTADRTPTGIEKDCIDYARLPVEILNRFPPRGVLVQVL